MQIELNPPLGNGEVARHWSAAAFQKFAREPKGRYL